MGKHTPAAMKRKENKAAGKKETNKCKTWMDDTTGIMTSTSPCCSIFPILDVALSELISKFNTKTKLEIKIMSVPALAENLQSDYVCPVTQANKANNLDDNLSVRTDLTTVPSSNERRVSTSETVTSDGIGSLFSISIISIY